MRLVGSTELARLSEEYLRTGFVEEDAVLREITPCFVEQDGRKTDIVVLACTHYPFLVNRMRKVAPWPVDWIDTSEAIARRTLSLLSIEQGGLENQLPDQADIAICTDGAGDVATRRLMQGFGLKQVEMSFEF